MAIATVPILDLVIVPTHNSTTMAIADASIYPLNWNIGAPTLQVTPPSFPVMTMAFTPRNIILLNSDTLGLTCTETGGCLIDLPDGIYKLKYSITPAYLYFVEKYILRVDNLMIKYDTAYLKLDIFQCDGMVKKQDEKILDDVEEYIQGAIAAANKCAQKLALELYNKANKLLDAFLSNRCYI